MPQSSICFFAIVDGSKENSSVWTQGGSISLPSSMGVSFRTTAGVFSILGCFILRLGLFLLFSCNEGLELGRLSGREILFIIGGGGVDMMGKMLGSKAGVLGVKLSLATASAKDFLFCHLDTQFSVECFAELQRSQAGEEHSFFV